MRSLVLVLLLCGCGVDRLRTVTDCGLPCTPWLEQDIETPEGECQAGTVECEEGGEPTCVGAVEPVAEICDGLDNDCDGTTDGITETCESACGPGTRTCKEGVWSECSGHQPSPEICNGKDDDCDGEIDEASELPIEFCYTGPAGTVAQGTCHPGTLRCYGGIKVCAGDQPPKPETCNGLDDDCDGVVDNGLGSDAGTLDLVFVVDNSGSMTTSIANVRAATSSWASKYSNKPNLRFAVVTAPDPDNSIAVPRLYQNFGTPTQLSTSMAGMGDTGSGAEPTLDALHEIAIPENPLGLTWAMGARRVAVVYSDEEPQSYMSPLVISTQVVQEANASGLTIHVFTAGPYLAPWLTITNGTQGQLKDVSSGPAVIEAELDQMIQAATCTP